MTEFRDLDEFFDDSLRLPVGGKVYVIPAPDAEVGLLCQRLMHASLQAEQGETVDDPKLNELAEVVLNDDEERDLYQRILGPVWDELHADKVKWPRIQHVGATALVWVAAGKEAAAKIWASGGTGEAPAPNRATRRATAAAATSTRSRGSGTTTTRTTASRSRKAAPSRGKTS
ncbi:DUF7426 family protein [Nonomuraea gerenzanensis]|uniref:DUF7426 family protein n=1 Tax=Nonomuraea gerenzanensis TaxID=93944 RepID=UPI001CD95F39|nr:hypothetical protein [Nonomuraea gerenzanensis]UBU16678.1 hypothetical protein LCN96_17165 [Nonomuraea gerenzanensis]